MSEEELEELRSELEGGRAALLVMCDESDVQATSEYLTAAGGRPRAHAVNAADLEDAAKQAEAATSSKPES